jgi:dipeptidyl aminopeptidase/acylaminoacyl peptidase
MEDQLLQQLLTLPTVVGAYLSPDKRWIAFNWYRVHANMDVFVLPTDGSTPPIALTHTPEYTSFTSWAPDSRSVIVAEDHASDERVRLFRVWLDRPEVLEPLTEDRPPFFLRGGDLHPNQRWLIYGANFDFQAEQETEATWIYRHDLHTGERVRLAQPAKPTWSIPSLNKAGSFVIYPRKDRHPSGRQFHLVDIDGKDDHEILNFGDAVKTYARWFPDSERILFLSESTGRGPQAHLSLGIYHCSTGEIIWLLDDPHRFIESAWVTPDGLVVVDEIRDAGHSFSYIDTATGVETAFLRLAGNLLPLGQTPDGAWVGYYYSARVPAELVRFDLRAADSSELVSLTHVWERTELAPSRMAPAEAFNWESVDGLTIQGWLYRAFPNPHRAILYIHGGPTSHSEDKLNPQIQYFVAKGFNVLDVNYRGSTGFGLPFREAIKVDGWGGREQADIVAGAQALISAGLADPGRVGVTGTSYGGYSSWYQITHAPKEMITAAAPVCGMTDLVVDYHTTRPDLRPYSEEMLGGKPDEAPERYFERSPINFVQDIRGALLIVQGAQDPNVTPENVRQVEERLKMYQIPYDILIFADEGHGIIKPTNQKVLYPRLAEFFNHALGK